MTRNRPPVAAAQKLGVTWQLGGRGFEFWAGHVKDFTIDKRNRKKAGSSRNVVHKKDHENMDRKRKTNEEVMEMAGYTRSLLKVIRHRLLKFFGHIIRFRSDGLEKQLQCGKIEGVKSRGRQGTKYTNSLSSFIAGRKSTSQLIRTTNNREEWRAMISNVCNGPGT